MHKPVAPRSHEEHSASCVNCALPDLCLRAGMSEDDIQRLDRLVYARRTVRRGEDLYRAADPFSAIYAIRSGFFKTDLVMKDGRHQIMGFHMPGEILGMDGIGVGHYTCNAVALEDAEACSIPLTRMEEIQFDGKNLLHRLHQLMSAEIVREQHVMVMLGGKDAEARLAAFLVDISRRLAARQFPAEDFNLPMTREEIGSFLGLTLETVSRMFSRMQAENLLDVQQRHIRIRNQAGLERLLDQIL